MRHRLICHPTTPQSALSSILVGFSRRPGGYLNVSFRAVGRIQDILWPGEAKSGYQPWIRGDELWNHSCFELFVTCPDRHDYVEINLATSGEWAGYAFDAYRQGMRPAEQLSLIAANWQVATNITEMHALLEMPMGYHDVDWLLGLTAVIEARDGGKSYWSLAHAAGAPDFHNRDCFAASLPAPERA